MCKYSTTRRVRPIYTRKTWCWKSQLFPSPTSPVVSQLLEVFHLSWNQTWYAQGQISLFDAAPHYTDLVLQCSLSLHENENCEGAAFFKTASPTKDNRQSLREQHTENDFASIQKAPPEIPVKNWEQAGISKHHHHKSKHVAKNTAARWIWYPSSVEQVWEHKTMQWDIIPGKVERKQCCILPLLLFFSAGWLATSPGSAISFLPRLRRCHRPRPAWLQPPEGHTGWKQLSSLTRGSGDWLLLSVMDKSPV